MAEPGPVRPHRRRCVSCGRREAFRYELEPGHTGGAVGREFDQGGRCFTCQIQRAILEGIGALPSQPRPIRRRLAHGGRLNNQSPGTVGPGQFTVRRRAGKYLVRYPGRSRQFTVTGQLGQTWGHGLGRTPVIVQEDGSVLVLDPRAIITRKGQRVYGPRMLPRDQRSPALRAWLAQHRAWDRGRVAPSRPAGP